MLVRDLMTTDPVTVTPDTSLADGLQRMAASRVRHLLVLGSDGDVIGIVSDRDLALFYDPQGITPDTWQQVNVSRLMTSRPVTIGSAAPLADAARTLLESGFSALPVVDNGQLVGILTERDFVKHALKG
jgi:acetoin utilization protein AcuB